MVSPPEGPAYDGVVRPPGAPSPLGATWTPEGLNVAVRAPSADSLEACLWIDDEDAHRGSLAQPRRKLTERLFAGIATVSSSTEPQSSTAV